MTPANTMVLIRRLLEIVCTGDNSTTRSEANAALLKVERLPSHTPPPPLLSNCVGIITVVLFWVALDVIDLRLRPSPHPASPSLHVSGAHSDAVAEQATACAGLTLATRGCPRQH
jgi:hypothetical protein